MTSLSCYECELYSRQYTLFLAFAGNSQYYRTRHCGQPDALSPEAARLMAIVHRVVHSTEGERMD